ncbi:uncharacterized protein LTR77_003795 [Saxophila tyrrhenica]|uniref:Uncharacterized protein n=1 Tax=Saxophila tyrrhenica TaxID=1690608 RepID=A0AAV9PIW6_9PEZI|nr:hypothetical protein LTR77_003795 [Saxophila tyrrhenica]
MAGKGASRRNNIRKAQAKQAMKRAAKKASAAAQADPKAEIAIPNVTEDHLLAFQMSHFSDDVMPAAWFIDPDTALSYDPAEEGNGVQDYEEDLGYYEDGVKRTLTDEQIKMFRHSEVQQFEREKRRKEEAKEAGEVDSGAQALKVHSRPEERIPSSTSRSNSKPSVGATRKRKEEVPYAERHKRKWEAYVEKEDPVEGSMTQNRLRRELDNQKAEAVELDY